MANSKSDKATVSILIIACAVVILIFHFAWSKYLFMNYSRPIFVIGDLTLVLAFAWASLKAYNNADDPNYDGWRWAAVLVAVLASIWAAAWSTGLMNNISQGI
jgi:hypothetical protein